MKMMKTRTTPMAAMIIFIFMFCHHILLRSCRPVLWKRSACTQATRSSCWYPCGTTSGMLYWHASILSRQNQKRQRNLASLHEHPPQDHCCDMPGQLENY